MRPYMPMSLSQPYLRNRVSECFLSDGDRGGYSLILRTAHIPELRGRLLLLRLAAHRRRVWVLERVEQALEKCIR